MITYLLKSGLLLAVFYIVYKILLENEKMFHFNRIYLLASIVFSLTIPLQLFSLGSVFSNGNQKIQLNQIMIVTSKAVLDKINYSQILIYFLAVVYGVVTTILVVRFIRNLFSFYFRMKKSKVEIVKGGKVVLTKEKVLPHSFWNIIFINQEDFENDMIPEELIVHEKAHLKQKHTVDILFVEVLKIVFWFNPLYLLYEKAIKLNHEFLADEAVNKKFGEVRNYQNLLLDFVSHKNTLPLASNLNYLITKKRLLMMAKEKSPIRMILKVGSVTTVYVLLLFVFNTEVIAQSSINAKNQNDYKISYDTTSVKEPQFPGGIEKFYMFVGQNFKMPTEFAKQKMEGKIFMEFMVEKDGSLSEFKIVKDLGYGVGDEAVRVLKLSPKWIPATENGKPVRVTYNLPITIQAPK
ncbi:Gram-negative bacterial tonB protein [Flavobacterium anhuiense]|uniref:Gram-negative bacterial tonB protein n=1 Tax=Flavobacterium anhuiense TaxID=459526 RepID=A0AAC9CYP9_9FLAO|nr:M56 family metallopeptidase [Flavobacterium anhuiense]AOC94385.1 Gram-negative bacterial tonB protein [Flavobacterium anhuiense]